MTRLRLTILLALLLLTVGLPRAAEPQHVGGAAVKQLVHRVHTGSPDTELSAASDAAPWTPELTLSTRTLSHDDLLPANHASGSVFALRERLRTEARVESEGENPSYWRVLGPVLITVGVGSATWLLFTLRSS